MKVRWVDEVWVCIVKVRGGGGTAVWMLMCDVKC